MCLTTMGTGKPQALDVKRLSQRKTKQRRWLSWTEIYGHEGTAVISNSGPKGAGDIVGQWHPKGVGDTESNPWERHSVQLLVLVSKGG